jgi:hypothetical protein
MVVVAAEEEGVTARLNGMLEEEDAPFVPAMSEESTPPMCTSLFSHNFLLFFSILFFLKFLFLLLIFEPLVLFFLLLTLPLIKKNP